MRENVCLHIHGRTHTDKEKPHWRVHLVWLCYRFILIWANVSVSKGERRNAVLIDKPNVLLLRTLSGQSEAMKSRGCVFPFFFLFLFYPLQLQCHQRGRFQWQITAHHPASLVDYKISVQQNLHYIKFEHFICDEACKRILTIAFHFISSFYAFIQHQEQRWESAELGLISRS